jgi:hypothetical protein
VATIWILLLNALVGFQFLDDGTPISIGLLAASGFVLLVGTGYIALDTAFQWTGHFDPSLDNPNKNIGLYVLYQLFPIVCLFLFFVLESLLVIRILGERKPMRTLKPLFPSFYFLQPIYLGPFHFTLSTHLIPFLY